MKGSVFRFVLYLLYKIACIISDELDYELFTDLGKGRAYLWDQTFGHHTEN